MKKIIDVTLTAEQKAGVNAAVAAITTAMPFLHSLSVEQRKALVRIGPRRQSFARLALEIARQQGNYIPPSIDLAHMERDLDLYDLLTPVRIQLAALLQQVIDTQTAAGHDACEAGLEVYRALRSHAREAGLDAVVSDLRVALRRAPGTNSESEPPAEGGTNS